MAVLCGSAPNLPIPTFWSHGSHFNLPHLILIQLYTSSASSFVDIYAVQPCLHPASSSFTLPLGVVESGQRYCFECRLAQILDWLG